MKTAIVVASLLALAGGKEKAPKEPADPNAQVAKAFGGKVYVADDAPAATGEELRGWLSTHKPSGVGLRKDKDGPWKLTLLAVFKKAAFAGPMTVQVYEKSDLVDEGSLDNDAATLVYRATYDCEPDKGFNKGHKYTVKVGQILKGKFVPYAAGDVALE